PASPAGGGSRWIRSSPLSPRRCSRACRSAMLPVAMGSSRVFRWRPLMSEGGKEAIRADEDVVPASEARKLEDRVRELERLLGRKTMEVEILKEALDLARVKKPPCCHDRRGRDIPGEDDRPTLDVARSNVIE